MPTPDTPSDLILNKGPYMLDSEQVHRILAQIADDTGVFSMILLRCVFPYDRYFITWTSGGLVMLGIAILIVALIICLINQVAISSLYLYILPLVLLIEAIAFLKYLETCFIRKGKPELTVALFIEIILSILNKHRNELAFGVQPHERQLWRHKIYDVLKRYPHICPVEEFSPGFIVPLSDPDEDELLTIVQFADIFIDFWAEKKSKTLNENKLRSELNVNITDRMGYYE